MLCPFDADPRCLEIIRVHSMCVYEKAAAIAKSSRYADAIDYRFLLEAAMLHDYGIIGVDAPGIYCFGREPYIAHGVIGARYLRQIDKVRYARHARVCERHIGSGLTAEDIAQSGLALPHRDYLPETFEEKLITYADGFFSKDPNHLRQEKSWSHVLGHMEKFGPGPVARLIALHEMWAAE